MLFWVFCQLLNGATQAEKARYHLTGRCQPHLAAHQLKAGSETGDNTIHNERTFRNSPDSPHFVIRNPGGCPCLRSGIPAKRSECDFGSSDSAGNLGSIFSCCRCTTLLQTGRSLWHTSLLTSDMCTAFFVGPVAYLDCKITPRKLFSTIRISWHECFPMTLKMTALRSW